MGEDIRELVAIRPKRVNGERAVLKDDDNSLSAIVRIRGIYGHGYR